MVFSPDAASAGRRALANVALDLLSAGRGAPTAAERAFERADNMTDRLAALAVLAHQFPGEAASEAALADFYRTHEDNDLVLDKWFALQATVPRTFAVEAVAALAGHAKFKLTNPNRARALIGSFATGNPVAFNRPDGGGFRWVADRLIDLDRINPQVAARTATAFRSWKTLEPKRRDQARLALARIEQAPDLSLDLRDIVTRSLR